MRLLPLHSVAVIVFAASTAIVPRCFADSRYANLVINEIFFDPPANDLVIEPGSGEIIGQEYIELRGQPGLSLDGNWLALTENEDTNNESNPTGNVDHVFDLSGKHIGSNGYLLILPKNFDRLRPLAQIAPGTAVYQNTGSTSGFGSGEGSSIGADDQGGNGVIENGAFSALLIRVNSGFPPFVDLGLDFNEDSIIDPELGLDWTVVDSVGQLAPGDEDGSTYSAVTFTAMPMIASRMPPGAVNVYTELEPEYLFRYGSAEGQDPEDWVMANVTNNVTSGWTQAAHVHTGYVVSGPHSLPLVDGELVRGLPIDDQLQSGERNLAPEGTVVQNTLGRPNWPIVEGDLNQDGSVGQADLDIVLEHWQQTNINQLGYWLFGDPSGDGFVGEDDRNIVLANWSSAPPGDYNGDLTVDAADYGVWKASFGSVQDLAADGNDDGIVDAGDYTIWRDNFGSGAGAHTTVVAAPEPAAVVLVLASIAAATMLVRCRSLAG